MAAPASGGRDQKNHADEAEISPISMKAGRKCSAEIDPPLSCTASSTASAPMATPAAIESCWATLTNGVARLMRRASTSAYAIVLVAVNCSERKKPPTSSTAIIIQKGVFGVN